MHITLYYLGQIALYFSSVIPLHENKQKRAGVVFAPRKRENVTFTRGVLKRKNYNGKADYPWDKYPIMEEKVSRTPPPRNASIGTC